MPQPARKTVDDFTHEYEQYEDIAESLLKRTHHRPSLAVICGSGLGGLADLLENPDAFNYEDIPYFPTSTVHGHVGRLVFGLLNGVTVVCMQGRFHFYEGYDMSKTTIPVRVFKLLGVHTVIVTNAAGGLNPEFKIGDIMLIKDHINMPGLAGNNPLMGQNDRRWGPRFVSLCGAYDRDLRELARNVATNLGLDEILREGVYTMVSGPCFETVSEAKAFRSLGSDCMGMSTAPEVIVARHCGLRVLGISLITNNVVQEHDSDDFPDHEAVLIVGKQRAHDLQRLISELIFRIADEYEGPATAVSDVKDDDDVHNGHNGKNGH
ncbi:Purine nucleoside phosphorylase [Hypsibius exemplaris]|uniref:Purine nucleoside phosphorylase n=1 Tax=Hypsibius exemplaris TaxID=2072580 RepID=A0A1W0WMD5_HYPEX|nr:Purine nucleoside phosphorylase [Hypsibius exemplaris]